jgi:TPR repeat protein
MTSRFALVLLFFFVSTVGYCEVLDGPKLRSLCDSGDRPACVQLGVWEETQGNIPEAIRVLKLTCEQGQMEGCNHLGTVYTRQKKFPEALRSFEKPCANNFMESCLNIGNVHLQTKNYKAARISFTRLCALANMDACTRLAGVEFKEGHFDQAALFAKKSCDGGEKTGCVLQELLKALPQSPAETTPGQTVSADGLDIIDHEKTVYADHKTPKERKNVQEKRINFYQKCLTELSKTLEFVDPVEDCKTWQPQPE